MPLAAQLKVVSEFTAEPKEVLLGVDPFKGSRVHQLDGKPVLLLAKRTYDPDPKSIAERKLRLSEVDLETSQRRWSIELENGSPSTGAAFYAHFKEVGSKTFVIVKDEVPVNPVIYLEELADRYKVLDAATGALVYESVSPWRELHFIEFNKVPHLLAFFIDRKVRTGNIYKLDLVNLSTREKKTLNVPWLSENGLMPNRVQVFSLASGQVVAVRADRAAATFFDVMSGQKISRAMVPAGLNPNWVTTPEYFAHAEYRVTEFRGRTVVIAENSVLGIAAFDLLSGECVLGLENRPWPRSSDSFYSIERLAVRDGDLRQVYYAAPPKYHNYSQQWLEKESRFFGFLDLANLNLIDLAQRLGSPGEVFLDLLGAAKVGTGRVTFARSFTQAKHASADRPDETITVEPHLYALDAPTGAPTTMVHPSALEALRRHNADRVWSESVKGRDLVVYANGYGVDGEGRVHTPAFYVTDLRTGETVEFLLRSLAAEGAKLSWKNRLSLVYSRSGELFAVLEFKNETTVGDGAKVETLQYKLVKIELP